MKKPAWSTAARTAVEARLGALDALAALAGTDAAISLDLRRHDGGYALAHVTTRLPSGFDLPPGVTDGARLPDALGWDPVRPARRGGDRFRGLVQDDLLRDAPDRARWADTLAALGVTDVARAVLHHDGRFLGCVALLARGTTFSRRRLRALSARHDDLVAAYLGATRLERPLSGSADAVLGADGVVREVCAEAEAWLDEDRRAWLAAAVAALGRGEPPASTLLHAVRARFVRLSGPAGTSWLAHLTSVPPLHVGPSASLSERQLQIAELAAVGMTLAQIAAEAGLSEQTVGSHLKEVYQRLHVSTRVDLAAALGGHATERST